ncbi:hypothetical protein [Hanstruepera flava]|uniref:hypothetical protein n=1 Tax=Hanstruepera flava TaxID=2930218 RepID=UPI002027FC07|nr:hypothetical protein [Hanstruepera flava]
MSILNCASYSKDTIKTYSKPKTIPEFGEIDGKYKIYGVSDSLNITNIYENIFGIWWNSEKYKLDLNTDYDYFAELKLVSEKELEFNLYQNGIKIKNDIIKGRIEKGIFYIKQSLSISGLPYIFGTFANDKKRIILNDNSIIIERINHEFGAILVIFPAGFKYTSLLEYERIK